MRLSLLLNKLSCFMADSCNSLCSEERVLVFLEHSAVKNAIPTLLLVPVLHNVESTFDVNLHESDCDQF